MCLLLLSKPLAVTPNPYQSSIHPINDDPALFPSCAPWEMPTGPSTNPGESSLDLGSVRDKACATAEEQVPAEHPHNAPPNSSQTPATSTNKGSFNYDCKKGDLPMRWANITEFDMWCWMRNLLTPLSSSLCSLLMVIPMLGGKDLVSMWSPMCSSPQWMHMCMHMHPCPSLPPWAPPLPLHPPPLLPPMLHLSPCLCPSHRITIYFFESIFFCTLLYYKEMV